MSVSVGLFAFTTSLAASVSGQQVPPATSTVAFEPPAVVAAKANQARVKVPPSIKSKKDPEWTKADLAAVRKLGEHGRVTIAGIIGTDGRYTDLIVRTSSRGAALDAYAKRLAGALIFTPARDAAGAPVTTWAAFPFQFLAASLVDVSASVFAYRCDAAVRDWDWWKGAWPERTKAQYETYNLITGMELLANARSGGDPQANAAKMASFSDRWDKAVSDCRSQPSRLFLDALGSSPSK